MFSLNYLEFSQFNDQTFLSICQIECYADFFEKKFNLFIIIIIWTFWFYRSGDHPEDELAKFGL
jgi:hypothetical protein